MRARSRAKAMKTATYARKMIGGWTSTQDV
jgi:hypothetical protein